MDPRSYDSFKNDHPELLEALPVRIGTCQFECGCWGRGGIHWPEWDAGTKSWKVAVGIGYQSNKHFHTQNFSVVDFTDKSVLIRIRRKHDYGVQTGLALLTADGKLVNRLPKTLTSAAEAEKIAVKRKIIQPPPKPQPEEPALSREQAEEMLERLGVETDRTPVVKLARAK